jgi:hypothetical protein
LEKNLDNKKKGNIEVVKDDNSKDEVDSIKKDEKIDLSEQKREETDIVKDKIINVDSIDDLVKVPKEEEIKKKDNIRVKYD